MADVSKQCIIWSRFELKLRDGSVMKLRIQDVPSDRRDDVIDFTMKVYVPDEAFHRAAGVSNSEDALREYRTVLRAMYQNTKRHVTVCCIDDDSNNAAEFIGMSVMQLATPTSKSVAADILKTLEIRTKEVHQFFHIIKVMQEHAEDNKYYTFYDGRGIMVHPDFRGLGIANQLVRVRRLVCADEGVPMTRAWMTAVGSQKAAEKNGWKTLSEISRDQLDTLTGLTFEKTLPVYKLMYTISNQL